MIRLGAATRDVLEKAFRWTLKRTTKIVTIDDLWVGADDLAARKELHV